MHVDVCSIYKLTINFIMWHHHNRYQATIIIKCCRNFHVGRSFHFCVSKIANTNHQLKSSIKCSIFQKKNSKRGKNFVINFRGEALGEPVQSGDASKSHDVQQGASLSVYKVKTRCQKPSPDDVILAQSIKLSRLRIPRSSKRNLTSAFLECEVELQMCQ